MIKYTKEYIGQLLDKFMDGTTTLEEEGILADYLRTEDVPREWEDYRQLFQEIEAMRPQPKARRQWAGWSIAAAIVAGGLFLVMPSKFAEQQPSTALTAQVDTTTAISQPKNQVVEQETEPKSPKTEPVQSPKRSRRKPHPTMTDHDKAYALMAAAEMEQREVERQLAQCQQEILQTQLASYGYVPVRQEDGTITYINEQTAYYAYEE